MRKTRPSRLRVEPVRGSSIKQRALRGATWAALGSNAAQVLAFVMFVFISRVVGPAAFGVVSVSLLLVEFARAFTSESIAVNLIASGRFERTAFDAGLVLSGGLALAAMLILVLGAPIASGLFGVSELVSVLPQIAPLVFIYAVTRLFEAEAMLRMEFRSLAIRSVGAAAIGGAAGVAAAYNGLTVEALVLQQWGTALTSAVLLGLLANWRPTFQFSRSTIVNLARQSAALSPAGIITSLRQALDGLAVASFSGAAAAGLYNLAKRTRLALQLGMNSSVGIVSLPSFGMVKDDPVRLASGVRQAVQLTAVSSFPVFLGIAAVAHELIAVFLGPSWQGAAVPLQLLMFAGAFTITTRFYENLLLVREQRGIVVAVNAFTLVLLILLIVLFGRAGPVAIAACVLAICVVQNVIGYFNAAKHAPFKLREYLVAVWVPMIICVAMIAIIALMRDAGVNHLLSPPWTLALFVLTGVVFYLAAAWALARPAVIAVINAARLILSASPANS